MTKLMDPVGYLGPEERWKMLGVAVVKQAVVDYKDALKKEKNPAKDNKETHKLKKDAETFLRSSLCEFYSGCDGSTLLRKMKAGLI